MSEFDMTDREWSSFIADMIEFCERILSYTSDLEMDYFANDTRTCDATLWNLRLIGEAANHVPPEVQKRIRAFNGDKLWECGIA